MARNRISNFKFPILLVIVLGQVAGAAEITASRRSDAPVSAYERVELNVKLDRQYANPFDPDEIAMEAKITAPGGKHFVVPGFWGQDFPNTFEDSAGIKAAANGQPSFRVRFCPTTAGRWSATVSAKDRAGVIDSAPIEIDVSASANRGFVRVARDNRQYLQFDSGDAYFPIGLNLAWANGEQEDKFVGWLERLHAAGGNFARIWLCHPPVRIENEQTGLGRYDLRHAAFFDDLLSLCERDGVYVMLCINNHRDLLDRDRWGPGHWPKNPYNAANGGPAKVPIDFFTSPPARKLHQRQLRYLIARYASFTSLACWELFNEQENTQLQKIPDNWNLQMAEYLRQNDPFGHLVSTSAALPDSVWQIDAMSITQSHIYGDGTTADVVMPIVDAPRRNAQFNKPHLIGECGISFAENDSTFDPNGTATTLHNTLWASMMSGACGAASYWWWNNYIEPKNLWSQLTPVAKFAATVDWPRRRFTPVLLPAPLRMTDEKEKFSDLVVKSIGAGAWGKADGRPIVILRSGQVSGALPYYLFGNRKPELRTRTILEVDLPRAGDVTFRIAKVSDFATLRVWVDGDLKKVFQYDASPGMPDQISTATIPQDPNVYQAVFNQDRVVPVPAGRHTVELDVMSGDWLGLDRVTLAGAKSSRFADLKTVALQDDSARQTLAWLYDATSNWQDDRDGKSGRRISDVSMTVPMRSGSYEARWWDTRAGTVVRTDQMTLADGLMLLKPPEFSRDIAVQITPTEK